MKILCYHRTMGIFTKKLILAKTHDRCAVDRPKLTVVMIHGIAANSSSYTKALQYLEGRETLKTVRFVTFDLLGAGKSLKDDKLEYNYREQLEALHRSIKQLKVKTPLVLVGHSMGTFIVTRYANTYKKSASQLILVSPPVYTVKDLADPAFEVAIKMFEKAVSTKNPKIVEEKSFQNSMRKIVMSKYNYKNLVDLKTPTTLIYGNLDKFVASFNYPRLIKQNSKYLSLVKTEGAHGVSRDKYTKIAKLLEGALHA